MYEDLDKKQIRSYRGEIVVGSVLWFFVLLIAYYMISSGWLLSSDTLALLKEEAYLKEETENESEKEPKANRQYKLGAFYLNGGVVWRNYDKAFNLFSLAEKKGNTDAKQALMECYRNGYGCHKDIEKAEEMLWKLNSTLINARNGNAASQYQAGVWYYNGKGELSVNKEKAIYNHFTKDDDIPQPEHSLENEPKEMGKTEVVQDDVFEWGEDDQAEVVQDEVFEQGDLDKTEIAKDDNFTLGEPNEPDIGEK